MLNGMGAEQSVVASWGCTSVLLLSTNSGGLVS
jgi:hypothetical protein